MATIRKSLLQLLFSGAYLRRWNDKLRPREFYEIDKQAHKMIVAFALSLHQNLTGEKKLQVQQEIIEHGLFDYLYRLIITDIKPPVFYQICAEPSQYTQLTTWVLSQLRPILEPMNSGFWERFQAYHLHPERKNLADEILEASHLYASGWEFNVLKPFNSFDDELPSIAQSFMVGLQKLHHVPGVSDLIGQEDFFPSQATAFGRFAKLCGQLRFQIRWSDTPRIPESSVLGHMFLVASYAYFCSLSIQACPSRAINNYFAGLVHDLPELLTRDIISPVKRSFVGLPELLRSYELQELERKIFKPLHLGGHDLMVTRLRYYLGLDGEGVNSEFTETIIQADKIIKIEDFDHLNQYNSNEYDPKDGALLKACDNLAAFIEAHASMQKGLSSPGLYGAVTRIRSDFQNTSFGNLSFSTLVADFD